MLTDTRMRSLVQPELEAGEQLLWVGSPAPMRMARASLGRFCMGIVWSAITGHFMVNWYSHKPDVSGPGGLWGHHGIASSLFFVPFILGGAHELLSPLLAYLTATRTVYAITSKRALIITRGRTRKVRSYPERDIRSIQRDERQNGTGDVTFARTRTKDSDGNDVVEDVKFVGIPDVRLVERVLRETFAAKL